MNVLVVYAHPEPGSLTGALKDVAVEQLRADGHEVRITDLYAMGWKAQADAGDFGAVAESNFMLASGEAYREGTLSADIRAEQEKLLWADTVLLHFPLWWFSMPAIMKGWVDRVLTCGFAYGAGGDSIPRYGAGVLAGRRAMLVVSVGGKEPSYSDRGINGPIEDLLFPIQHGILYYPGMDVLPPFVVHGTIRVDDERFGEIADDLRRRMSELEKLEPIRYRPQGGGDYDRSLRLESGRETPGSAGFGLHVAH
ncbi:NAD(P)H-dependent oxidoreductase [Nocardia sp. CS682]|uniref:NAD(P)H-dependent oxidoreductase n=1 Tax=Nocardia sp. CS682 TaxID=1047172 RepID=UPI001074A03C|nr:NAD(P)H-dependent oxidoreductase [Nocardia sp. CS682]QBS45383.1 NAD(P)H dehydrogenase [Nocardia sp. CS682]